MYLARVGLQAADQWASVIGVFVALAGLGVAVYGVVADRNNTGSGGGASTPPGVSASGERSIAIGGDNTGIASTGDQTTNTQPR
ncbi:hypothetical protein [Streptosporangium sp. NPDC023615]|uniref:hypothetical protein n=1 Tax=Streptosporangium sp. NPDC023615 TaxID=3154794 RepID=UPI0034317195